MKPCRNPATRVQRGFSMIEVLVAVLILGIGLLGAGALQLLAVQNINNAELRTQATLFAQELSELARTAANPADFEIEDGTTGDNGCSGLSGQFEVWCAAMGETLPGAEFSSEWVGASRDFIATITWPERLMFPPPDEDDEGTGEGTASYTLVTRFPQ